MTDEEIKEITEKLKAKAIIEFDKAMRYIRSGVDAGHNLDELIDDWCNLENKYLWPDLPDNLSHKKADKIVHDSGEEHHVEEVKESKDLKTQMDEFIRNIK